MTPAARVQAGIERLDRIIAAARDDGPAADTLIARYFKDRRYAGSKDRRAVRDLVYRAIRAHGERPESGRAAMLSLAQGDAALAALFDGGPHAPAPIGRDEPAARQGVLPDWLAPLLADPLDASEREALLDRAPLHLRANGLKADREALIGQWPDATAIAQTPGGISVAAGTDIERDPRWLSGMIEIQDAGSQIIAHACEARAGMTVLDLCAGGGGKTLALAADMGGQGRLIAADTARVRLARLEPRAGRAGCAAMIETVLLDPGREMDALAGLEGRCDVVLVDAPCSGTGTWRRNPEARWRLTPDRLDRLVALQARLLRLAVDLVRPGGRLVYAVCSLVDREGRGQVHDLLGDHPAWSVRPVAVGREWGGGALLSPKRDGTDGFFFTVLEKPC